MKKQKKVLKDFANKNLFLKHFSIFVQIIFMSSKNRMFPLYLTNFFGVFNDNLLKSLISLISVYWVSDGNESVVIMLATAFMVLPFIIFAPFSGYLSKTLKKRKFVILLKSLEFIFCSVSVAGFYFQNIYVVMFAMFLMGMQSTFFSPMKFALVRDIGGEENSSIGTGAIEMTTFMGVLLGTFLAGVLTDLEFFKLIFIGISFFSISILGLVNAILIKADEPKTLKLNIVPLNFVTFLIRRIKWSSKNAAGLNVVVLGLSMFWMIGSLLQLNLFIHLPITLGVSAFKTGVVLATVAVSIGLGSLISGIIAKKRVALELIPNGGSVFVLLMFLIYFLNPSINVFFVLIVLAAFFAGLMKTPLNAWMQVNVKGRQLGDAIAYNNLANFIFILISAGLFAFVETNFGSITVFLVSGVITILMISIVYFKLIKRKKS